MPRSSKWYFFPSGVKTRSCVHFYSATHPTHLTLLHMVTRVILDRSTNYGLKFLMQCSPVACYYHPLRPNTLLSTIPSIPSASVLPLTQRPTSTSTQNIIFIVTQKAGTSCLFPRHDPSSSYGWKRRPTGIDGGCEYSEQAVGGQPRRGILQPRDQVTS